MSSLCKSCDKRCERLVINYGMARFHNMEMWGKPSSINLVLEYRNILENIMIKKENWSKLAYSLWGGVEKYPLYSFLFSACAAQQPGLGARLNWI